MKNLNAIINSDYGSIIININDSTIGKLNNHQLKLVGLDYGLEVRIRVA